MNSEKLSRFGDLFALKNDVILLSACVITRGMRIGKAIQEMHHADS